MIEKSSQATVWLQFNMWSLTDVDNGPYGKTYRHMKVQISEHQGVSPRTGKRVKGTLSTSVRDHMLNCNHTVDFSIIGRESNHFLLETKESLSIKRDKPSLNRNKYSQELFLF